MAKSALMKPILVWIYSFHQDVEVEDNVLDIVKHIIEHTEDQEKYWEVRMEYTTEEGVWTNHKFRPIEKGAKLDKYVFNLCKRWMSILQNVQALNTKIELRFYGENFSVQVDHIGPFSEIMAELETDIIDEDGNVKIGEADFTLTPRQEDKLLSIINEINEDRKV